MKGGFLRFALALLVGAGAGCTSAPVRYYTLMPPPEEALPVSKISLAVDVRVVHTPPQLNRSELMVRTGPTQLTLLENERWASPVSDEIRNALRLDLQRRMGRLTGLQPGVTRLTLDIDVHQLEAEVGQYVLLEASWSASSSASGPRSIRTRPPTCTFQADEKIAGGYAGMVEGYQKEIAAFADAIVAVLTSASSGIEASCQTSIEGSAGGSGSTDH